MFEGSRPYQSMLRRIPPPFSFQRHLEELLFHAKARRLDGFRHLRRHLTRLYHVLNLQASHAPLNGYM